MEMGMRKLSSVSALVFLALISASTTTLESEVPFMVVHKKASLSSIKSGVQRVFVTIDIHNQGSSSAYDVNLVDDTWNSNLFGIVSGNTSNSWEKLDVGQVLSHSFELKSKTKGLFYGSPAVVTLRVPSKGVIQAYSTPILPLDVLAETIPEKKLDLRLVGRFGSQVSVISIIVTFVYLMVTPSNGSKKKR
ncbi:translocon-associated protein beta (TRAPB) family protein [Raphanus sativus]|nr:translocon-associated protein beta (TRAPB) family protein [Raphanus sativus]